MSEIIINKSALAPLYKSWEEPNAHRVRSKDKDAPAEIAKGRRPSSIVIAHNLRAMIKEWRENGYFGASDTTRHLLNHWFGRSHIRSTPAGEEFEFRYYFCQREAIETLIYLKEVRKLEYLSQLYDEFGGENREIAALGITEEEDAWSRYAFKLATGSGKTKVMSLAIVWSYFHALRESDSPMAKHFVVIAPNITVFERLKEDFGNGKIFDEDPLIPVEWKGDWNLSTVLQDEAGQSVTGGTLYLTNIHRLYDLEKRKKKQEDEMYSWAGPHVSKAKALDTGALLRDRITSHRNVMVLNDEAHHVWDPDSAWNEAIKYIHETVRKKTGGGIVSQLDFSATPKDNKGNIFKHVVCDAPLGEAVDGGIVKTPVIGRGGELKEVANDSAAYKFEHHLRIGYERWLKSCEEWQPSGKKPLMFVMCDDTKAADEIAQRLNSDVIFKDLNGLAINLHTNLKGKIKNVGKGATKHQVFEESEKEISDEDLKELRKLSRELDSNTSPYKCIVSVLMLREGWDVRNVTTIIPLRPYSSKANILPEQTLGRGLRRMTPPGQAEELVTIVEHPAFASLYQQELAQEGVLVDVVDVDDVPQTTISIFPDAGNKDLKALDIKIPVLAAAHRPVPKIENLSIEDIKKKFAGLSKLPLGRKGKTEIEYEGRALFTNEVVERMKVNIQLLESGPGAISYYVHMLEHICRLRGTHSTLAPLVQTFFEEILFEVKATIFDQNLVHRLGDSDVQEHLRAVFIPLIRERIIKTEARDKKSEYYSLADWKPYQVTHSERRPAVKATGTLFNLVPCNRELEVAMAQFIDRAHIGGDVAAFAKNAGPQCLRIDYLSDGFRLAFYTPDFFVRAKDGNYYLIETKGREDRDVPLKARAAVEWCKSASSKDAKWEYVYVPQGVFSGASCKTVSELARTCAPSLKELLDEKVVPQLPLFENKPEEQIPTTNGIVDISIIENMPSRYKKAASEALELFAFLKNKEGVNLSPVFQPLLGSIDDAARGVIIKMLESEMPTSGPKQADWFDPFYGDMGRADENNFKNIARNLKKTLIYRNGLSPIGLLNNCMEYALNDSRKIGGAFESIKKKFKVSGSREVLDAVKAVNDFRNTYVAHSEKELLDSKLAGKELKTWIEGLALISGFASSGRIVEEKG
ncbi:MAG: DEAD/DEAH box helicase family protein [Nitrospinae bacterium]|nr:DEAD/DEAH box helicase family protein [Nitrospinota bacterium]